MEEDERRVMERRRENDRNMIKINAFYEPSSLLYSPLPLLPPPSQINLNIFSKLNT
jgi:hypothetical protein